MFMTIKFISDMGPKSALIAPRPFRHQLLIFSHTMEELKKNIDKRLLSMQ